MVVMMSVMRPISSYIPTGGGALYFTAWAGSAFMAAVVATEILVDPPASAIVALPLVSICMLSCAELTKKQNPQLLQNFVASACLVMSSLTTAFIFMQSLVYAKACHISYNKGQAGIPFIFELAYPLALLGWGIPITKILYSRGLELLSSSSWTPMENYLKRSLEERKKLSIFWDKVLFCMGIIHPASIQSLPFNQFAQEATIDFFSTDEKKDSITSHLNRIENLSEDTVNSEGPLSWELALKYFNYMPKEDQDKLLEKLLLAAYPMQEAICTHLKINTLAEAFLAPIKTEIETKGKKLKEEHGAFIEECQTNYAKIKEDPSATTAASNVKNLIKTIISRCHQIRIFCPSLDTRPLRRIQVDLQMGETSKKINTLVPTASNDTIDEEPTSYYLPINYVDGNQRDKFLNDLKSILGNGDSDEILGRHGIRKMGEFIEKVLDGDHNLLKNTDANRTSVLDRLRTYLRDPQLPLYTWLLGEVKQKSFSTINLAAKAAYYAVYLFQMGMFISVGSTSCVLGALSYPLYRRSPTMRRLFEVCSYERLKLVQFVHGLSQFLIPSLRAEYSGSDIYGKMRVLSIQLRTGSALYAIARSNSSMLQLLLGMALIRELGNQFPRFTPSFLVNGSDTLF